MILFLCHLLWILPKYPVKESFRERQNGMAMVMVMVMVMVMAMVMVMVRIASVVSALANGPLPWCVGRRKWRSNKVEKNSSHFFLVQICPHTLTIAAKA